MVAVYAKLTAKPGKGTEVASAFESLYEGPLDEEKGTRIHILNQSKENSDVLFFYELYEDDEAFKAHSQGAVVGVFPKLSGLLAGPAELVIANPLNAKGVDL